MRILFVGERDTGRGPLARAFFEKICLADPAMSLVCASAGVVAIRGQAPFPAAAAIARESGLRLRPGGAQPLSRESLREAEMIVCMERRHRSAAVALDPVSQGRCRMLGQYRLGPASSEIADGISPIDPVDIQGCRLTFASIASCLRALHADMARPAEEVYMQEIESHVRALRDSPPLLSPREVDLIDRWWRDGVPLWLALDSIRSAFRRAGSGRARSLMYCVKDVAERMGTLARDERAPSSGGSPAADGPGRLLPLARMRASGFPRAADLLERLAGEVRQALPAEGGTTGLTAKALEAAIVLALREETPREDLATLRCTAEERLMDHRERMTREAWETTITRHIERSLRQRAGLSDFFFPTLLEAERDPL